MDSQQIVDLEVDLQVLADHYLYLEKTKIVWPKDFAAQNSSLEVRPTKVIYDKFSKKEKEVIMGKAKVLATVELPVLNQQGKITIPLGVRYQACSATYCLLPKTKYIDFTFHAEGPGVVSASSAKTVVEKESLSFEKALEKGWFFTFLFVFFAGVLTSFTPCVFPMIPITLAVIGSQSKDATRLQSFTLSLFYVLGIALTYSILGVFAAKTGALFGSFMSNPIVVGAIAGILIVMALSMFGLFEIKTPSFITNKVMKNGTSSSLSGAFGAGLVAGVVASPCVGPVLVGILAFVAKTQSLTLGFWLLFIFAMGLGLLFLVLGTFSSLIQYLPKSGPWMDLVKFVFGISMLALALYFASPLMPREWVMGIIGFGSMCIGFALGFLQKPDKVHLEVLKKLIGSIGILVGAGFLVYSGMTYQKKISPVQTVDQSMHMWQEYSEEKLAASLTSNKPVIIDFKADWCAACKELEEKTFSTQEFKDLAKDFDLYYIDATNISDAQNEVDKYGVLGLPTVIFYDRKGKVRDELTVSGFEEIEAFSKRMLEASK